MENSATRTELDTIINAFLSSELNAKEFVTKLNDDLFSNENLLKMHDYLKSNRQESVLMHFYENLLLSIPVKPDNDKLQKMNPLETLEYLQILREEAFDKRVQELEILKNDLLPNFYSNQRLKGKAVNITNINNNLKVNNVQHVKNIQNNNTVKYSTNIINENYFASNSHEKESVVDNFIIVSSNELHGLNYYITNNDSELDALFDFLKHEKLIEKMDKRMFKVLFREKFEKDTPKIHFKGSASLFANMIKEMMRLKKDKKYIFQRSGRSYHHILDNVFEKVNSKNEKKMPSEIMNTVHVPKKEQFIFKKFTEFLKANFKSD